MLSDIADAKDVVGDLGGVAACTTVLTLIGVIVRSPSSSSSLFRLLGV